MNEAMAKHGGGLGGLTCWLGIGLGVGRRPPPGRIPATAFAGANSDKALASSGIEPRQKPNGRQTTQGTPTTASTLKYSATSRGGKTIQASQSFYFPYIYIFLSLQ